MAIYSRALNANEVGQNFSAGRKRGSAATVVAEASSSPRVGRGLSALYTFDAGSGDVVKDRSELVKHVASPEKRTAQQAFLDRSHR